MAEIQKQSVLYGAWNAVKKVPEWQTKNVMKVYDTFFTPTYATKEEQAVAAKTRNVIEKLVYKGAIGVDAAMIVAGVVFGYKKLHSQKPIGDISKILTDIPIPSPNMLRVEHKMLSACHPGTLVPLNVKVADVARENMNLYSQLLMVNIHGNNERAKAFLLSSVKYASGKAESNPGRIAADVQRINHILTKGMGDRDLVAELLSLMDRSNFVRPVGLIQGLFQKHLSTVARGEFVKSTYNFWAEIQFPWVHQLLGIASADPKSFSFMSGLSAAARGRDFNPIIPK